MAGLAVSAVAPIPTDEAPAPPPPGAAQQAALQAAIQDLQFASLTVSGIKGSLVTTNSTVDSAFGTFGGLLDTTQPQIATAQDVLSGVDANTPGLAELPAALRSIASKLAPLPITLGQVQFGATVVGAGEDAQGVAPFVAQPPGTTVGVALESIADRLDNLNQLLATGNATLADVTAEVDDAAQKYPGIQQDIRGQISNFEQVSTGLANTLADAKAKLAQAQQRATVTSRAPAEPNGQPGHVHPATLIGLLASAAILVAGYCFSRIGATSRRQRIALLAVSAMCWAGIGGVGFMVIG